MPCTPASETMPIRWSFAPGLALARATAPAWVIVSGAAAERGKLAGPTHIVDAPVTALVHMGVNIEARWNLDGRPIGLKPKR